MTSSMHNRGPRTAPARETAFSSCGCSTPADRILDPEAAAAYLGIKVRHLSDLRREDAKFPLPRMLGTLPRWTERSLYDYVASPSHAQAASVASAGAQSSGTTNRGSRRVN